MWPLLVENVPLDSARPCILDHTSQGLAHGDRPRIAPILLLPIVSCLLLILLRLLVIRLLSVVCDVNSIILSRSKNDQGDIKWISGRLEK